MTGRSRTAKMPPVVGGAVSRSFLVGNDRSALRPFETDV